MSGNNSGPAALLKVLLDHDVRIIVIGSAAATGLGVPREHVGDLDVVYDRAADNQERLYHALKDLGPYPRGGQPGDAPWDVEAIDEGYSFITATSLGDLDLFAEISGIGLYEDVLPESVECSLWGMSCRCLSAEQLIHNLKCSGRKKDRANAKSIREWLKTSNDLPA